ncbi:NAD-dependent succinate-semialdehyde dehydrogenase [Paenirhodobacter populi]|uniref:NAD-dependent succinate-semialdehyde dehydrogenase n=1 Tax=Paenirhodobacter populi TaxID=2306993 RepID=A0A443IKR7_9RHOB|nr:NAD-dependent succinate-semialdehyde dehydrogenase [Sinirhodobacter populi]RWR05761.1 NAD-dependent succinate-semialdehyde dehydrogenase [Sinirhodobacter populi]
MLSTQYPRIELVIGAERIGPEVREARPVLNPATGEQLGMMPSATPGDLDRVVSAAEAAFAIWRAMSAYERSAILRRFADLLRANAEAIATNLTRDMGKPLSEAVIEIRSGADHVDWHAEEGRRIYGRIIPARAAGVQQQVLREPVGACLAISPWNFPMSQAVRKIAAALASGCTVILKAAAETPSSVMAMADLLREAGLPDGCLNLLWGDSNLISQTLLARPEVKKLSFTGSIPVGKHLAELAGRHMKRLTMELGGHAPVLVFDDADPEAAARALAANKLRNAGQVCISPTRFFVQERGYDRFVGELAGAFAKVKVGNGLEPGVQMGPLCHPGRVVAMESLVGDAVERGANVVTGGSRIGNVGNFYAPTIVTTEGDEIALMNDEPFGPIAVVSPFCGIDDGLARANRLPLGLASYVFTNSLERAEQSAAGLQAGMVSVNHFGLALPETPFGGVRDSGYGTEGGSETFDAYLNTKFVSMMTRPVA